MSKNTSKFISIISCILVIVLNYIFKIREYETALKRKLTRFVVCLVMGLVVLLCVWLSIQAVIFFWLLSFNFSLINAALSILGLNLVLLIGMIIWVTVKGQSSSSSNDLSLMILSNTIIKVIETCKNPNKD